MFEAGKNFEEEALGLINKKKEKDLAFKIIFKEVALENYKGSWETVNKILKKYPEENRKIEALAEKRIYQYFVSDPQKHPYDIDVSNEIVKQCQPAKMRPLAEDLYYKVFELMNLTEYEDDNETPKDLKFYTAVGSKSDCPFGVDALLTYNYLGKEIIVSVDITLNQKDSYKADILYTFDESVVDSRDKWSEPVEDLAKKIKAKFIKKINLYNNLKKQ